MAEREQIVAWDMHDTLVKTSYGRNLGLFEGVKPVLEEQIRGGRKNILATRGGGQWADTYLAEQQVRELFVEVFGSEHFDVGARRFKVDKDGVISLAGDHNTADSDYRIPAHRNNIFISKPHKDFNILRRLLERRYGDHDMVYVGNTEDIADTPTNPDMPLIRLLSHRPESFLAAPWPERNHVRLLLDALFSGKPVEVLRKIYAEGRFLERFQRRRRGGIKYFGPFVDAEVRIADVRGQLFEVVCGEGFGGIIYEEGHQVD